MADGGIKEGEREIIMKKIDFENISEKFQALCESSSWIKFVDKFLNARRVYVIGNGGLHFTAAHAATDCTRLIDDKSVTSMDTTGFITSCANDYGYENLFIKWIESTALNSDIEESMVIGMSCSGNSKNITRSLAWAQNKGFSTAMISGRKSKRLDSHIHELVLECEYFHTVEVLCLMLFYQLIHESGNECPSILKEVERKDPWAV